MNATQIADRLEMLCNGFVRYDSPSGLVSLYNTDGTIRSGNYSVEVSNAVRMLVATSRLFGW
jgi:hypothetical protein